MVISWSSKEQRAVAEFHADLHLPLAEQPTMLAPNRLRFRCSLLEEEVEELREAANQENWLAITDALVDILYFTYGTAVEMGLDLQPFFDEVHRANLAKTPAQHGEKPAKPAHWSPPDLERVFRQVYGPIPIPTDNSMGMS